MQSIWSIRRAPSREDPTVAFRTKCTSVYGGAEKGRMMLKNTRQKTMTPRDTESKSTLSQKTYCYRRSEISYSNQQQLLQQQD